MSVPLDLKVTYDIPAHIVVRPGQRVDLEFAGIKLHVEGVDHNPCRDTSAGPLKPDMMVILRAGEEYVTRRDDGTVLKVRAE